MVVGKELVGRHKESNGLLIDKGDNPFGLEGTEPSESEETGVTTTGSCFWVDCRRCHCYLVRSKFLYRIRPDHRQVKSTYHGVKIRFCVGTAGGLEFGSLDLGPDHPFA